MEPGQDREREGTGPTAEIHSANPHRLRHGGGVEEVWDRFGLMLAKWLHRPESQTGWSTGARGLIEQGLLPRAGSG